MINYHNLLTKKIENKIYQSSCQKHSKIDHHMSNNAMKAEGIQKHCLRPIVNKM